MNLLNKILSRFSWRLVFAFVGISLFATLMTVWALEKQTNKWPSTQEIYFGFYFYPEFKHHECTLNVSIQFEEKVSRGIGGDIYQELMIFLREKYSTLAYIRVDHDTFYGNPGEELNLLFEFIGDCDLREQAMNDFFNENLNLPRISKFSSKISNVSQNVRTTFFWLDAVDYDPNYWGLRKKAAGTCDGRLWSEVARYHFGKKENHDLVSSILYGKLALALGYRDLEFEKALQMTVSQTRKEVAEPAPRFISKYASMQKCKIKQ